jgi:response regulator of citrate/malate metabolism
MSTTVLIVEDEFIVANDLRLILEQAGYKVKGIAASGREAINYLNESEPDIVILDIYLKGKQSGIDFATTLRKKK